MKTYNSSIVKAIGGKDVIYFASLTDCAKAYGIRYEAKVKELIEQGGLAPDGRTFFDYPTEQELELLQAGQIYTTDLRRIYGLQEERSAID